MCRSHKKYQEEEYKVARYQKCPGIKPCIDGAVAVANGSL